MKRWNILIVCGIAVLLAGARKQTTSWESPYTPTRLEWLALQCNLNHPQSVHDAHVSFLAVPPNELKVIVKLTPEAKAKDPMLRGEIQTAAKEYVGKFANAMGWKEPLDIEAVEVMR